MSISYTTKPSTRNALDRCPEPLKTSKKNGLFCSSETPMMVGALPAGLPRKSDRLRPPSSCFADVERLSALCRSPPGRGISMSLETACAISACAVPFFVKGLVVATEIFWTCFNAGTSAADLATCFRVGSLPLGAPACCISPPFPAIASGDVVRLQLFAGLGTESFAIMLQAESGSSGTIGVFWNIES